ncbi:MAG TPA: diacylglycerol kinase family protein [Dehalococcoidia bacterium]|nr:diacylglycerol kinase family protein [Dehalococcoidia bacterium]
MSARLLTVIRNPSARRRLRLSRLAAALEKLERRGWRVECRTTAHIGHATALAALAAQRGSEAVLVCGGDGTINEAVNGLAGSETALAVLPAGTINLWAREVGLSADPAAAVRLMLSGERRRVDLGRVGDRYFLMLASVGVDAVAVRAVMAERKRRWGRYAYLAAGVSDLLRHGGRPLAIEAGEVHFRGRALAAIVGNTRLYAGLLHAAHRARIDDGLLDLRVYAGAGVRQLLPQVVRTLAGRPPRADEVYVQAARVRIAAARPLPVQADGEPIGTTPMTFSAVPRALTVIVPPGLDSPLFTPTPTRPAAAERR